MFGGLFFDIECFLFIDHVVKNVSFGEPLMVVEVFQDVISGMVIRNFDAHGRLGIRTSGGPSSRACFWGPRAEVCSGCSAEATFAQLRLWLQCRGHDGLKANATT